MWRDPLPQIYVTYDHDPFAWQEGGWMVERIHYKRAMKYGEAHFHIVTLHL